MLLRRLDYKPYPFEIQSTLLHFVLEPETTVVHSLLSIKRKEGEDFEKAPLVLDGNGPELKSLQIDGVDVPSENYEIVGEELTIKNVPKEFKLSVTTEIHPEANTTGSGLYYVSGAFTTQCEPQGFRKMTYYPDRPDVMSVFTVEITANREKYPVLLSNGNPLSLEDNDDGTRTAVWSDPFKKGSYLFALVAGDLDYIEDKWVTTPSKREVTLRVLATKEFIETGQCKFALDSIKTSAEYDERRWGREYDLDLFMIFVSPTFNMGAMENKGLNIFNVSLVLALPETATDADYERIEGVVAHEYFHNWSGDRVTVANWFQISLKEGFTVYRDQEFSRERWGIRKEIADMALMTSRQFAEDAGPLAHPIRLDEVKEMENNYTLTVYEKGAEVVRMIEVLLGKETFRKGTDLYFERHDGQACFCEDFVKAMEDASGVDLTQFREWYKWAGTPVVEVTQEYNPEEKSLTLTLTQSVPPTPGQPVKPALVIPFVVGFVGFDGDMYVKEDSGAYNPDTGLLVLRKPTETFVFRNVPYEPALSLNRRFAPVRVKYAYRENEIKQLAAYDPCPLAKWSAVQTLGKEILINLTEEVKAGRPLSPDERIAEVFKSFLEEEDIHSHLLGAVLALPSEDEIANEMPEVDPIAIHTAREFLKGFLAERFFSDFASLYFAGRTDWKKPVLFDPESVAIRTLANLSLSYLSSASGISEELFLRQAREANNMTDTISALRTLVHGGFKGADTALESFYKKFEKHENVVDKWFAIQATIPDAGTLERVKTLMEHPAFNIKNPNRVRSLLASFAMGNPVAFHDLSGEGYKFFADFVIKYDKINPGVASRMVEAITGWKRYDKPRQKLMVKEVLRLGAVHDLSKGTREKVTKSLEGLCEIAFKE